MLLPVLTIVVPKINFATEIFNNLNTWLFGYLSIDFELINRLGHAPVSGEDIAQSYYLQYFNSINITSIIDFGYLSICNDHNSNTMVFCF